MWCSCEYGIDLSKPVSGDDGSPFPLLNSLEKRGCIRVMHMVLARVRDDNIRIDIDFHHPSISRMRSSRRSSTRRPQLTLPTGSPKKTSLPFSRRQSCSRARGFKTTPWPVYESKNAISIEIQLLPDGIHARLGRCVHFDHGRPGTVEAFRGPFSGGIDAHLAAVVGQPRGMVE